MTIPGDAFQRILLALNEAVFEHEGWLDASAVIDECCRINGSALVHATGNSLTRMKLHLAKICTRGERREDYEQAYFDHYMHGDERLRRFRDLPHGRVVHLTDIFSETELKNSAVYNEFLREIGKQDGLDVRIDGPDNSRILFGTLDSIDSEGWSSDQLRLIESILPHIRHYVRMREVVAEAGGQNSSFAKLLELSGIGVVKVDAGGQILVANDRALDELQSKDGLTDRGGKLSAVFRKDNDRLQRLLAMASPRLRSPAVGGSMIVHRLSQRSELAVHVHPAIDPETGYVGRRVASLVLIVNPFNQGTGASAGALSALGLTSAEAEIALLLAEGWTARQIAENSGRAYSTVRSHLKNINSKLGVSRQYDVARHVLALSKISIPDA